RDRISDGVLMPAPVCTERRVVGRMRLTTATVASAPCGVSASAVITSSGPPATASGSSVYVPGAPPFVTSCWVALSVIAREITPAATSSPPSARNGFPPSCATELFGGSSSTDEVAWYLTGTTCTATAQRMPVATRPASTTYHRRTRRRQLAK